MSFVRTFLSDARLSLRSLARTPGFWLAASATLALGIAVSTALFSVVDAVQLRPLPYSEPEQRVMVWSRWVGYDKTWVSDAELLEPSSATASGSGVTAAIPASWGARSWSTAWRAA